MQRFFNQIFFFILLSVKLSSHPVIFYFLVWQSSFVKLSDGSLQCKFIQIFSKDWYYCPKNKTASKHLKMSYFCHYISIGFPMVILPLESKLTTRLHSSSGSIWEAERIEGRKLKKWLNAVSSTASRGLRTAAEASSRYVGDMESAAAVDRCQLSGL